ncbi:nucleolin [Hordeum vulgare]|nr:nucleolin [Hordeum vulgare]
MPKSSDDRMIRGHSINLLQYLDSHTRFRVMDLIVETIRRTVADQKRSCGYGPYIQMLINAKIGKHAYLLDHPHLPLQPEFEDNVVVLDETDPSSAATRMAPEAAEAEAARNEPPPVP